MGLLDVLGFGDKKEELKRQVPGASQAVDKSWDKMNSASPTEIIAPKAEQFPVSPGPTEADRGAFSYGGSPDAYRAAYEQSNARANAAASNPYGYFGADRLQSLASRGTQMDAANMWRNYALGTAPSAAEAFYRGALDRSIRAGQSAAASARGGGYAASAANAAAVQQATQGSLDAANQMAGMRANEQMQGLGGYGAMASQIAGHDLTRSGQALGYGGQQQDLEKFYRDLAHRQAIAEQGGQLDYYKQRSGADQWAQQTSMAQERADADRQAGVIEKAASGAAGYFGAKGK